ncbi:MAG: sugar phosphate isomerase/epimerase [Clostridia bacterium]|nr:sugar phosphate isomerase/epimerase [Clostridia bacterium]
MKIATTTGDFAQYAAKRTDIIEILPLMAKCGIKYVDLDMYKSVFEGSPLCGDGWKKWAYGIGEAAAELGLTFVQAHSSNSIYKKGPDRDRLTSLIKREIEVCQILNISGITVHGIKNTDDRNDFMEINTEFYGDLLQTSEKTGVMVYAENSCKKNSPIFYLYDGDDMNELRQRLNAHPLFGFCWDVGHAHIEGVDQYRAIMTMGDGLKAVHIHDNNGADHHLQPYSGGCSYDPIVKGLIDVGYKGYFTLEAFSLPTPQSLMGRKGFKKEGVVFDRLIDLPVEFKLRSETLMLDIVKYMLESYNCFEE